MISCEVEFSEKGLLKLSPETYEKIGKEISHQIGGKAYEYIISGASPCPVCTGNLINSHKYRETTDGSEIYVGPDSDPHHIGEPASLYWQRVVTTGATGKPYYVGDYQGENHPLSNHLCIARSHPIDYPKETVNTVIGSSLHSSNTLNGITKEIIKETLK